MKNCQFLDDWYGKNVKSWKSEPIEANKDKKSS